MLRAIFTVRLLDDGNNRYQPDGGWHTRGERGNASVMIIDHGDDNFDGDDDDVTQSVGGRDGKEKKRRVGMMGKS